MHKSIHSLVSLVVEADSRGLFVLQASASLFFIVSVWFGMDEVDDPPTSLSSTIFGLSCWYCFAQLSMCFT